MQGLYYTRTYVVFNDTRSNLDRVFVKKVLLDSVTCVGEGLTKIYELRTFFKCRQCMERIDRGV